MPLLKSNVIKYLAVKDKVIFNLLTMSKLYTTSHHIFFFSFFLDMRGYEKYFLQFSVRNVWVPTEQLV